MPDDVLVLLDGSKDSARSVGPAAAIARYLGATLVAVGFYESSSGDHLTDPIGDQLQSRGDVKLEIKVEPLTASVGKSLARLLDSRSVSLICMSTHGRGRSAAVLGSVASEVLDVADCPVLLVGPGYNASSFRCHGPMLVALNGTDGSRAILPVAQEFASTFDYELEIATVVDPKASAQFEQLQAAWGGSDLGSETAGVQNVAIDAQHQIEAPVSFTVLHDSNPATALAAYAAETNATLLAMATSNRSGLGRAIAGSTVASVARHAPCPVLAIRVPADE